MYSQYITYPGGLLSLPSRGFFHSAKRMGIVVFPALNFNNACHRVFEIYESVMNMHRLKLSKDNIFPSSFAFIR